MADNHNTYLHPAVCLAPSPYQFCKTELWERLVVSASGLIVEAFCADPNASLNDYSLRLQKRCSCSEIIEASRPHSDCARRRSTGQVRAQVLGSGARQRLWGSGVRTGVAIHTKEKTSASQASKSGTRQRSVSAPRLKYTTGADGGGLGSLHEDEL